jgi:hypothetical protein
MARTVCWRRLTCVHLGSCAVEGGVRCQPHDKVVLGHLDAACRLVRPCEGQALYRLCLAINMHLHVKHDSPHTLSMMPLPGLLGGAITQQQGDSCETTYLDSGVAVGYVLVYQPS